MKVLDFIFGAVIVLILGFAVVGHGELIKTGNVGLMVNHITGSISPQIRHAGFNRVSLLSGQELIQIPTHQEMSTMVRNEAEGAHKGDDSILVNSMSSNTMNVDVSFGYHIDSSSEPKILTLYKKYRNQFTTDDFSVFEESTLRPVFRQSIVDAFGKANTTDLMTGQGRTSAETSALTALNTHFNPDGITIDSVDIRTIYPDARTAAALQSNLQSQQNLRLSTLNNQLTVIQNQKAILSAQAEAEAAKIRAQSLTPRLVKFRHIKDITITGVPSGSIINLSGK